MIFRTLLFFVVMYFLVKIISRLFLQSNQQQRSGGTASTLYRVFQRYAQQNQQQNRSRGNSSTNNNQSQRFEEIEEAEFEEITDDEETTSKTSE